MTEPADSTRAVFIAGNGHSGSTLLSLILGCHGDMVGLGDVTASVQQHAEQPEAFVAAACSCDSPVGQCELWGPTTTALAGLGPRDRGSLAASYQIVLASFRKVFGPSRILVDASRNLAALRALRGAGAEPSAIHLLRDVRSWTVSMRDRDARRGQHRLRDHLRSHGTRGALRFAKRSPAYYFRYWYRQNRESRAGLEALGLPVIRLGYEEIATAPAPILSGVTTQLGLEFDDRMLVPARTQSHSVRGNTMRREPAKLAAISYDTRWLTRREWMAPALVFPRIMRYNAAEVYSNAHLLPWGSRR